MDQSDTPSTGPLSLSTVFATKHLNLRRRHFGSVIYVPHPEYSPGNLIENSPQPSETINTLLTIEVSIFWYQVDLVRVLPFNPSFPHRNREYDPLAWHIHRQNRPPSMVSVCVLGRAGIIMQLNSQEP